MAAARGKLAWAHDCMHGTASGSPGNVDLYPSPPGGMAVDKDALRWHAFRVHAHLAPLRGGDDGAGLPVMRAYGYGGPWLENRWLARFGQPHTRTQSLAGWRHAVERFGGPPDGVTVLSEDARAGTVTLREPFDFDLFYPWVPLFARWEDLYWSEHFSGGGRTLPYRQAAGLLEVIRQDVQYVTLTQRASGFLPAGVASMARHFQNVLVLAAGGNGHVALPLLAAELPAVNTTPLAPRTQWRHKLAFAGQLHHHPLREAMRAAVRDVAARLGWRAGEDFSIEQRSVADAPPDVQTAAARALAPATAPTWRDTLGGSILALAPRGFGATSFRLYEALQLGGATVPVYVHDGRPWLPYAWPGGGGEAQQGHLKADAHPALFRPGALDWASIAPVVDIRDFPQWLAAQGAPLLADQARLRGMQQAIADARDRYFTYDGVLRHVAAFLQDPSASDLRCTGAMRHSS